MPGSLHWQPTWRRNFVDFWSWRVRRVLKTFYGVWLERYGRRRLQERGGRGARTSPWSKNVDLWVQRKGSKHAPHRTRRLFSSVHRLHEHCRTPTPAHHNGSFGRAFWLPPHTTTTMEDGGRHHYHFPPGSHAKRAVAAQHSLFKNEKRIVVELQRLLYSSSAS